MERRTIQLFMGVALLVAATFFVLTNVGWLPPAGTAMRLDGWRFAVAIAANFVFGALMCAGIGNYAAFPLVTTLGEHLTLMRWVVVVVIVYAAVSMLRSTAACVAARNTVEARKSADA